MDLRIELTERLALKRGKKSLAASIDVVHAVQFYERNPETNRWRKLGLPLVGDTAVDALEQAKLAVEHDKLDELREAKAAAA